MESKWKKLFKAQTAVFEINVKLVLWKFKQFWAHNVLIFLPNVVYFISVVTLSVVSPAVAYTVLWTVYIYIWYASRG